MKRKRKADEPKTADEAAADYVADMDSLWHEDPNPQTAGEKALATYKAIEQNQSGRRRANLDHAKLYANQDLSSIYDMGVASNLSMGGVYLSVNLVESCINTLAAKATRTRIRPVVQTERGKRSLRRAAEGMTQFIDGCFHASELHEGEGEQIFVDGACFGTGVAYTYVTPDQEVITERVLPDEMLIDDTDTMYGKRNLRELARKKYIHIDVLLRMPNGKGGRLGDDRDTRAAIRKAVCDRIPGQTYRAEASRMVPVYFCWRLPSKKGADDGRHLMVIEGATLLDKKWKRDRLPFDFFIFQRRPTGIWGRSLAEQLVPIQIKVNDLIDVIDDGQEAAVPRTFYQTNTIDPDQFDNELGRLIATTGLPSQVVHHDPGLGASEEMYKDLETWIRRGYETTGISMLSAAAEKPEGINSAVALRELLDREDLRYAPLGKRWERFNRDVGSNQLETADELYSDGGQVSVQVPGDKFLNTIDWEKIKLPREKYTVTVGAASALPTTPAARKQYAEDLLKLNVITPDRFAEIVDESGDVKAATSMVTAARTAIELDIEKIVEDGKWIAPDPILDPALARDMAVQEYAKARHEDVEDDRLEMLRRYIMLAVKYSGPQGPQGGAQPAVQPAEQAAAAQQAPAPGAAPPPAPAGGIQMPPDMAAGAPLPVPPVPAVAPM